MAYILLTISGCAKNSRDTTTITSTTYDKSKLYRLEDRIRRGEQVRLAEVRAAYQAAGESFEIAKSFEDISLYYGNKVAPYYFRNGISISATEGFKRENENKLDPGSGYASSNAMIPTSPTDGNGLKKPNVSIKTNSEVEPELNHLTRTAINHLKEQCREFGFKFGSIRYGDCVMKLASNIMKDGRNLTTQN